MTSSFLPIAGQKKKNSIKLNSSTINVLVAKLEEKKKYHRLILSDYFGTKI